MNVLPELVANLEHDPQNRPHFCDKIMRKNKKIT